MLIVSPSTDRYSTDRRKSGTRLLRTVLLGICVAALLAVGATAIFVAANGGVKPFIQQFEHRVRHDFLPRFVFYRWIDDARIMPEPSAILGRGLETLGNWASARLNEPEVTTLYFDIRFKHMQKLRRWRDDALRQRRITRAQKGSVPASIRLGDRAVRVRLRLKGDMVDHLQGNKWSFRIEVKGKDHLMGMRRFSIQHPGTRGHDIEALYMEQMRREGVLAPRYFFIEVVINGQSIGRMALEEHFSKELTAAQQRTDSVIIRFDEAQFWRPHIGIGKQNPLDSYATADVLPFRRNWIRKSPERQARADIAIGLLKGFQRGNLPVASVFDVETMATFLAVTELWGGRHGLRWINLRFYYNPITGLLEPIAFDNGKMASGDTHALIALDDPFWRHLLQDSDFQQAYRDRLRELSTRFLADGSTYWMDEAGRRHRKILHADYPFLMALPVARLKERARYLANLPQGATIPPAPKVPHDREALVPDILDWGHLFAVRAPASEGTSLELVNRVPFDLEIIAIRWRASDADKPRALMTGQLPITLAATRLWARPRSTHLQLPALKYDEKGRLELEYRQQGDRIVHRIEIPPGVPARRAPLPLNAKPSTPDRLVGQFPFLEFSGGAMNIKPGDWIVDDVVRLPRNLALNIRAGTILRFTENAGLIVRGPLNVAGSEAAPVILRAHHDNWAGIAVLNAGQESTWRHVRLENLAGWSDQGWNPTGAVTFYQSPAHIENSTFIGSQAEDMLNLVRGEYSLSKVSIRHTRSDALDADFTRLRLHDSDFAYVGGDAVDLSGSDAEGRNLRIATVGDKALSVGEGSTASFARLAISDVGTGIASKDGSTTRITQSSFERVRNADLTAYIKKPEYGAARLSANDVGSSANSGLTVQAQHGSLITVDGTPVEPLSIDVDYLYEQGPMKK